MSATPQYMDIWNGRALTPLGPNPDHKAAVDAFMDYCYRKYGSTNTGNIALWAMRNADVYLEYIKRIDLGHEWSPYVPYSDGNVLKSSPTRPEPWVPYTERHLLFSMPPDSGLAPMHPQLKPSEHVPGSLHLFDDILGSNLGSNPFQLKTDRTPSDRTPSPFGRRNTPTHAVELRSGSSFVPPSPFGEPPQVNRTPLRSGSSFVAPSPFGAHGAGLFRPRRA